MSVTSANVNDLATFVNGTSTRVGRLSSTLETAANKAETVMAACSFQHPSTPSLNGLGSLLGTWNQNGQFVSTIREELIKADNLDATGTGTVADTAVDAALKAKGLDTPPEVIEVPAIELLGTPPYSGWKDDPINMANGNFVLRERDLQLHGIASALSVIRTYNSRDQRVGAFGPGWSSVLDCALEIEDQRLTFRGPDGGGAEHHRLPDGGWTVNRRRQLSVEEREDGWVLREGTDRTWRFDRAGTLIGFTAELADVSVERDGEQTRLVDAASGRWVSFRTDPASRRVASASTSDGRSAGYEYDEAGALVAVRRDDGDVTYELDETGLLAAVVDADGIVICRNEYDELGRVITQVERHGRETRYEYRPDGVATVTSNDGEPPNVMVHDRRGRMTAMIDGLGNAMRLTYDDDDNVVQVVDRTGAVTRYLHDERGNLVRRTDPDGLTTTYAWDDQDRLVSETDRALATTTYLYEGDQRGPSRVVQADGTEVRFTYDERGLITSVEDPDGVRAEVEWNRDGLVTAVVNGAGERITLEYDAAGRATAVAAPDGFASSIEIDAAGRVLALHAPDGSRRFDYSAAGRIRAASTDAGTSWETTLDAAGEVTALHDAQGPVLTVDRDHLGRVVATTTADGGTARIEYDPVGRPVATIDPTGGRQETAYDPEGRPLQHTDAAGGTWSRDVDVLGRTTMSVAPDGTTTLRSYHPNGELAEVTDAAGRQWTYEIDVMGRVIAATDPLGRTTTYRYTPGGRLAEVRSPLGRVTRREYDAAGRLRRIIEPDGAETVIERDHGGSIVSVTRDGVPTTIEVDEAGQTAAVAGPLGTVGVDRASGLTTALRLPGAAPARFEHDARGLLTRITDPAGVVTELTYDAVGRLTAHITGETSVSFTRDAAGRISSITDAYGHRTTFGRDPRGIIERIERPDGSGTVRSFAPDGGLLAAHELDGTPLLEIRRNDAGEIIGATGLGGAVIRLRRDGLGRVDEVGTDAGTVRYTWDPDGYLVSIADDAGPQVVLEHDSDGRLLWFQLADGRRLEVPDALDVERDEHRRIVRDEHGRTYRYDEAGRLVAATVAGRTTIYEYGERGLLVAERSDAGARTYRYGKAGELVGLVREDGVEVTYEHDATGRRTREVHSDGAEVRYGWDPLGRLISVVRTAPDGATSEDRILPDPIGRPARINDVPILWDSEVTRGVLGIGDERFVWHGDRVCSTADPAGTWDRRVTDDPWGDDGGQGVRLGYRGELALDHLLFLGARVYDTRTRTFLSPDPLAPVAGARSFAGAYVYAWCDPVNLVDPTGLQPMSDEDYKAHREAASKGFFRKIGESIVDDPWKFIAKAAVTVASVAIMAVATATMGPVGLILVGGAVGALSAGLNAAIDGKSWDQARNDMLVGGLFGAVGGPLGKIIPVSTASTAGRRAAQNLAVNALPSYGQAYGSEALSATLNGREPDWGGAFVNGTLGTVTNAGMAEVNYRVVPRPDLDGVFDGETPSSLLPDPASRTVLDINSASAADLKRVPGIGDTLANRIVEARQNGGFVSTKDLLDIPGIGPKRLEAIAEAGGIAL